MRGLFYFSMIGISRHPNLWIFLHWRASRQYVDQGAGALFSPYVAACLLSRSGRILDIDERSVAFLRTGGVLAIRHNRIWAPNPAFNGVRSMAIDRAARGSEAKNLICKGNAPAQTRYTELLEPNWDGTKTLSGQSQNVAAGSAPYCQCTATDVHVWAFGYRGPIGAGFVPWRNAG